MIDVKPTCYSTGYQFYDAILLIKTTLEIDTIAGKYQSFKYLIIPHIY